MLGSAATPLATPTRLVDGRKIGRLALRQSDLLM